MGKSSVTSISKNLYIFEKLKIINIFLTIVLQLIFHRIALYYRSEFLAVFFRDKKMDNITNSLDQPIKSTKVFKPTYALNLFCIEFKKI